MLSKCGRRFLFAPGAVRIDTDGGLGAEDGAHRTQPLAIVGAVATDLELDCAEAPRPGGLSLAREVVGIDCHQEGVRGDRGGSGGRETRLLREPVRERDAADACEEVGERGFNADVSGCGARAGGRQGAPGLGSGTPRQRGRDRGHAIGERGHARPFTGKGSALAQAGDAVLGLDADNEALALGQVARAGGEGLTQGNAPGPPANARDGGGGGHGRRGNLAISE